MATQTITPRVIPPCALCDLIGHNQQLSNAPEIEGYF
jgi:hypothetical protein